MVYNSKINYNRTEFEVFGQSSTVDSYLTGNVPNTIWTKPKKLYHRTRRQ